MNFVLCARITYSNKKTCKGPLCFPCPRAKDRAVAKPGSVSLRVPRLMKEVISCKWGLCCSETHMASVSRALVSWQAGSIPNAKAIWGSGVGVSLSGESLEVVVAGPPLLPCTTGLPPPLRRRATSKAGSGKLTEWQELGSRVKRPIFSPGTSSEETLDLPECQFPLYTTLLTVQPSQLSSEDEINTFPLFF